MDASYLGEDLIFVISQPRSGSTLLQRLLAGHPEVQTSAETWLMLLPAYGLRGAGLEADFRPAWASRAVREFLEYYADGVETHLDGVRAYARAIYGRVLEKHGRTRFLDKTPRYFLIVPELARLFPSARFILLWRNPLSVLASELDGVVQPLTVRWRPLVASIERQVGMTSPMLDGRLSSRTSGWVTSRAK
jgi:hypothetical protein